MSSAEVICLHNVSKTFGRRLALGGVSLSVQAGEMVALIGPSGSGKSTLLRAITGLVRIDSGPGTIDALNLRVQERGRPTTHIRQARTAIGFVFQQFNLVGRLSLYTNVTVGALGRMPFWRGLLGLWPQEVRKAAMSALARVGVADYAGQRANTLSGGQQQRGAIARALVQQAKVILADEPVASLDPVAARRVMETLRELNQVDGLTVLVTLHQVDHAQRYCDRAVALNGGLIVYDGPSSGLTRERLSEIYGPQYDDELWQGTDR